MTTIVLTRPAADSQRLAGLLDAHGFATLSLPLLALEPLAPEPVPPPVCDTPAIWIFISANAVRFGLPLLAPALRGAGAPLLIAVGSRTQSALRDEGFDAIAPAQPDTEGLLAMPALAAPLDRPIVIVKGEGGREKLAAELGERVGRVVEWSCYRRVWPEVDLSPLAKSDTSWVFQGSSGETVSRMSTLLAGAGREDLFQFPVMVPSDRVAEIASRCGWQQVVRAADASDESVLQALQLMTASGKYHE